MAVSALAGTALAGAAGAAKVYGTNVSDEGIEDRVYRLHYNAGQNRTDKFAAISGLVGAVATAGLLDTRNPRLLLGGAAAGAAMGVLAHVATYREEAGRPNAMLEEIKSRG
ncbi:g2400 [Coccomyxa elongata]